MTELGETLFSWKIRSRAIFKNHSHKIKVNCCKKQHLYIKLNYENRLNKVQMNFYNWYLIIKC